MNSKVYNSITALDKYIMEKEESSDSLRQAAKEELNQVIEIWNREPFLQHFRESSPAEQASSYNHGTNHGNTGMEEEEEEQAVEEEEAIVEQQAIREEEGETLKEKFDNVSTIAEDIWARNMAALRNSGKGSKAEEQIIYNQQVVRHFLGPNPYTLTGKQYIEMVCSPEFKNRIDRLNRSFHKAARAVMENNIKHLYNN
jgi:hypothetical protein